MTNPPNPPPPPEPRRRDHTLSVGLVAAGAALAGAAIAGGFTYLALVTAVLTTVGTVLITQQQISGAKSTSQSDFIRAQRQAIYTRLLTDQLNLDELEKKINHGSGPVASVGERPSVPSKEPSLELLIHENLPKLEGLQSTFHRDLASVAVIGSSRTRAAAEKVYNAYDDVAVLFNNITAIKQGGYGWSYQDGRQAEFRNLGDVGAWLSEDGDTQIKAAEDGLTRSIRTDLKVPD